MSTDVTSETAIFERIVLPNEPMLSEQAAKSILAMGFSADDRDRMDALAEKARQGTLTSEEAQAIDNYERVGPLPIDLAVQGTHDAQADFQLQFLMAAWTRHSRSRYGPRAENCCEYCRLPQLFDSLKFQIDHIVSRQHRGTATADNLALACYACNHHKGPDIAGFDVETRQVVALFNPRCDVWADHFQWNGPELLGLTPAGRVTVHVLDINRDFRFALRRSLIQEGVLPREEPR